MQKLFTKLSEFDQTEEGASKTYMIVAGSLLAFLFVIFGAIPLVLTLTEPSFHSEEYSPSDQVPVAYFELPRADGSGMFTPEDVEGKVTVYYFGYTSCPDVCPQMLFNLRRTLHELDDSREDVAVVFITIDWENDTPERIDRYLESFDEDFIGLYGTEETIQPVMDQFNVRVWREESGLTAAGYTITHSTSAFIVDKRGNLRLRMGHNSITELVNPDIMARDFRYLIRERVPSNDAS